MENIVASRRLRKSMLNEIEGYNITAIDGININKKNRSETKHKINFKNKTIIKIFIATLIVFTSLIGKLVCPSFFLNNKYSVALIEEYKKDYSKEFIMENIEEGTKKIYSNIKYIIPDKMYNYITDNYRNKIKPKVLEFNLRNTLRNIMKAEVTNTPKIEKGKVEQKIEEMTGMGGAEPLVEDENKEEIKVEEASSAMSLMESDIAEILSKNINIKKPVSGTITSVYGARDEIFKDVNPYHTGLDIANKYGTEILSATDGTVIKAELNNKYYGNYVEVEKDGVIFKYGHMKELKVKKGEQISQGKAIGIMGSTGMSTGPHLHFEIKINGRTIDPQQLVDFY